VTGVNYNGLVTAGKQAGAKAYQHGDASGLIRAINECITTDSAFSVRGNFKSCDTGEVSSWFVTTQSL